MRVGSVGSALPIVHAALFLEKWRIAERASLRDMPRVPPWVEDPIPKQYTPIWSTKSCDSEACEQGRVVLP